MAGLKNTDKMEPLAGPPKATEMSTSAGDSMRVIDCERPYQVVKARHGWFVVNAQDIYIGRALISYGEYCETEWQLLEQLLQPGKDVVEVGANIGSHTVPMARRLALSGRRLLAIEPQPAVFQNMCANLTLNALFNVLAENAACSDRAALLSFATPDYQKENNFGSVAMREDGGGNQRVRAFPLDDLIPQDFDVGLIKVDVEGFELKVLEGSRAAIARHRPMLYLENDRQDRSKPLIEWLWAAGYKICWHLPPLFNSRNFAQKKENIYPDIVSVNMLAVPKETSVNFVGFLPIEDADAHPMKRVTGIT